MGLTLEVITNSGWRAPKATPRPHFPPPRTPCPTGPTAPHDPEKRPTALLVPLPHCRHTTVQGGLTDQVNRVSPVSPVKAFGWRSTRGGGTSFKPRLRLLGQPAPRIAWAAAPLTSPTPASPRPPAACPAPHGAAAYDDSSGSGGSGACWFMQARRASPAFAAAPGRRGRRLGGGGKRGWVT